MKHRSQSNVFAICSILACCLLLNGGAARCEPSEKSESEEESRQDPIAETDGSKSKRDVHAVWELSNTITTKRLTLLGNGKVEEGGFWEIDDSQVRINELRGQFLENRNYFIAEEPGGGYSCGRLLLKGLSLHTEPAKKGSPKRTDEDEKPQKARRQKLEDTIDDTFELSGLARSGQEIHLTVELTENNDVNDGDNKIATWELRGRSLKLSFLDDTIGTITLSARNTDSFGGKSRSQDKASWTWALDRVKEKAVWDTNGSGKTDRVILYSNGRINTPNGVDGNGYWVFEAPDTLVIWEAKCKLTDNGRAFDGRIKRGSPFSGKLVSGSVR